MRLIKLVILSFVFLFLVVTVISLFIPGKITISKATNIAGDDKVIYSYINDLSQWRRWYPSLKTIPETEYTILKDSLVEIRATRIKTIWKGNEEIMTEMTSNNGRPVLSRIKVIRQGQADSSTLQWQMNFKLRWYPWEKFRSLFFENIYGLQMEQGLSNLKELGSAAVRQ